MRVTDTIVSQPPSRIKSNLAAGNITLSDEEIKAIEQLEKGFRYCNPPWGVTVFVS